MIKRLADIENIFQIKIIYRKVLRKLIWKIYKEDIQIKDLEHLDIQNSDLKSVIEGIDRDLKLNKDKLKENLESILVIKSSLAKYPKQFSFWERLFINNES